MLTKQDEIDEWKNEFDKVIKRCYNCKIVSDSPFCSVRCKYEWMQLHPDLKVTFNGEVVRKC